MTTKLSTYFALLRAVNVGGTKKLAMADLRALASDLGLTDVRTVIATGNLVFSSRRDAANLERMFHDEQGRLGLRTEFFVRGVAQWKRAIERNPFPQQANDDPGHLVLMVLRDKPKVAQVRALEAAIVGAEVVRVDGRELYAVFPDGIGTSKLTPALIERKLETRGTARNWNTVLKLRAIAG